MSSQNAREEKVHCSGVFQKPKEPRQILQRQCLPIWRALPSIAIPTSKALVTITITIPSLNWPLPKWHVTMLIVSNTQHLDFNRPSFISNPSPSSLLAPKEDSGHEFACSGAQALRCPRKFCCTYFFFLHADSYLPCACPCFMAKHLAVRPFLSYSHGNCSIDLYPM